MKSRIESGMTRKFKKQKTWENIIKVSWERSQEK